jgi:Ca-activated chloride channel family protein
MGNRGAQFEKGMVMRRILAASAVLLLLSSSVQAQSRLLPKEKELPPLALVDQVTTVNIDDQVAVTRIEQTFRNSSFRPLEATYVFPLPKGASVRKFSMWVDGKEEPGEMVEAGRARQIYTDIVRRTLDPGLLEYMDNGLIRMRVFPVPAKGDQKIAISYTSIVNSDNGLSEFIYPMRADHATVKTLQKLAVSIRIKSKFPITNIYSPSHPISFNRPSDREVAIEFERNAALLDRDFQLYYQAGPKDIGVTAVTHRSNANQDGHFMMLLSPRAELSKSQQVPRDMVMVLDTSGSMRGTRIDQAKKALKYCLKNLSKNDRFTLMNFATTVNRYTDGLQPANSANIETACQWVDGLEATGGTAIDDALRSAIELRTKDEARTFTVIFFTDGQPTVGETNPKTIMEDVRRRNTGNTRIFSFGVGDDVNTVLLDALADNTRAVSTYVRETEDIEAKVSSLYGKISNPVLANLKLSVSEGVTLSEVYPPNLPDLFHGNQLVVFGRYRGQGKAAVKLTGTIGKDAQEFTYDLTFADKTGNDKSFVEDLWARRKVGYMLDQIRVNGESKELVQEVITLAKRYGITTPYTSYLLVPDGVPAPRVGGGGFGGAAGAVPPALGKGKLGAKGGGAKVEDFAKNLDKNAANARAAQATADLKDMAKASEADRRLAEQALAQMSALHKAQNAFQTRQLSQVQQGRLGVDFAVQNNLLRAQERITAKASQLVQNRNVVDVGGVWIDDGFDPKMQTVAVKAMSEAYFRILEKHPEIREVYQLGNFTVWVTPSGKALVVDQNAGKETMPDAEIDQLFVASKK